MAGSDDRDPATKISWSLWNYRWVPPASGQYTVAEGATDGTGTLQISEECRTKDVFYVPGEHDFYDNGEKYRERFGKDTAGAGWHSFDQKGVHFTGLVNVANIQEGGLGTLGQEQLDWLEKDVKSLSTSTPIVLFAHRRCSG